MKKNTLGKTGLNISAIAYGGIVSTMGGYADYTFAGDGQAASDRTVEYALNAGINYFDVAPRYGDAQEKLGNSLRGVRDQIYLACKTDKRDYDSAAREVERSLNLLNTDHFDVYQLHALGNGDDVERAFSGRVHPSPTKQSNIHLCRIRECVKLRKTRMEHKREDDKFADFAKCVR